MYFFQKGMYAVYNGVWDKAPEAGNFRKFLCQSNLTICKVTLYLLLSIKLFENPVQMEGQ